MPYYLDLNREDDPFVFVPETPSEIWRQIGGLLFENIKLGTMTQISIRTKKRKIEPEESVEEKDLEPSPFHSGNFKRLKRSPIRKTGTFDLTEEEQEKILPMDRLIFNCKFMEGWEDWRRVALGQSRDAYWVLIPPEHWIKNPKNITIKSSYSRACMHCEGRVLQNHASFQAHLKTADHQLEYETEDEDIETTIKKLDEEIYSFLES